MTEQKQSEMLHQTEVELIGQANQLKRRPRRKILLQAGFLAVIGFQVTIPVLIALFIGSFLDKHISVGYVSFTILFILLGFLIGFYNAWRWIKENGFVIRKNRK